ncbi:MAG: branched-chain amino acid ABC transporter permease [Planctomycetia bacterium]|nr:branched-chain amino acid ABC transporter permease [Candidatus Brocadia sp.]QOJ06167.1 MAG: branched-chain amino acid ABC transporter permease [Planctomycetia bacterium]TVL95853.1 MAG: branched-chain amino acid ABC transporter permease [Candidatus Brocadia sp. BL1]HQU31260.1 branched-chain amino acid ABC transporter permease [Candidatus Brocadia sapporoensis]
MNYAFHLLIMIEIYAILALSLNLVVGYTGLLSLSHAAFYGLGAYASALLMMHAGLNFFPSLAFAVFITAIFSLCIGYTSLKLRGDYFAISSFAFQVIIFGILYNWVGLTRGPYGIVGIPRPGLFGFKVDTLPEFFVFTTIITVLVIYFKYSLYKSPFCTVLKAIREEEQAVVSMGKNVVRFKILAFVISSGVAAIAGGLYAVYITYIDPTSFTLDESIFILAIVLIGGTGNFKGPIVGVLFMLLIPEFLRFVGLPDSIAHNLRQIIYALILILLARFRPWGIAGDKELGSV